MARFGLRQRGLSRDRPRNCPDREFALDGDRQFRRDIRAAARRCRDGCGDHRRRLHRPVRCAASGRGRGPRDVAGGGNTRMGGIGAQWRTTEPGAEGKPRRHRGPLRRRDRGPVGAPVGWGGGLCPCADPPSRDCLRPGADRLDSAAPHPGGAGGGTGTGRAMGAAGRAAADAVTRRTRGPAGHRRLCRRKHRRARRQSAPAELRAGAGGGRAARRGGAALPQPRDAAGSGRRRPCDPDRRRAAAGPAGNPVHQWLHRWTRPAAGADAGAGPLDPGRDGAAGG